MSSSDGHCASHAERLLAGLQSLPTLPPEGDGWLWSAKPDGLKLGGTRTARNTRGHQGGAEERSSICTGISSNDWSSNALSLSNMPRLSFFLWFDAVGFLVKHGAEIVCHEFVCKRWPLSSNRGHWPFLFDLRTAQQSRFSWRYVCQRPKSSCSWGPAHRAYWVALGPLCQGNQKRAAWGLEPEGVWKTPSQREDCSVTWGRCNVSSVVCCIRCSLPTLTLPSWSTFR